ncbi:MAG: hypothetical protein ACRD4I_01340, partial [Candidatus Angelobacter sp.]
MKSQALLLTAAVCMLSCKPAAASGITVNEYRQQLAQFSQEIGSLAQNPQQAGVVEAGIPGSVPVQTDPGKVTVNYQPLKNDLATLSKAEGQERERLLRQITSYMQELEQQAADFDVPAANASATKRKLNEILARREFRNVHSPSMGEVLLSRILRWLARWMFRIHLPRSGFNLFSVVIWGVIGAVVLVLIFWTVRRLRHLGEPPAAREIIPFSPSARNWRLWLAEARENAERQDFRNAIHLAYWAGISFLESSGAWRPNRSRTPREYLRLLTSRSNHYPILSALTTKLE